MSASYKNIAAIMHALIPAGSSTEEILAEIYTYFPHANSGPKDVAWYRNKIRKAGGEVPAARIKLTVEQRKANKAAYEASYKVKQQEAKAERQAAALVAQQEAEEARIEAIVQERLAALLAAQQG